MRCCRTREKREYDVVDTDDDEKKFRWIEWKRPVIAVVLAFLCNVESSMLSVGEWPYLATIDREATPSFYGTATAVSKAGHAIFAFVFAVWAYKYSTIKIPMLVGRCITLFSCFMYISVEYLHAHRRYWMLVCYLLFGIGFGTSPLLRSYIALVTSEENRSTAYALLIGAAVLSAIVGPVAQIIFAGLPYPGVSLIPPHINLSIFTGPIWFAVITNLIAIVLITVAFEEPDAASRETEESAVSASPLFSLTALRDKIAHIQTLKAPWLLIAVVIFQTTISEFDGAASSAIDGPVMTVMYAFEGETIVLINAIAQVVIASLVLALSLIFFLCKLGKFISCRTLFLFSNILAVIGYLITYPYPFMSNPLQPFNDTTRTGCDPLEYSWCDRQLAVSIYPFLIILLVTNVLAIPAAALSIDTIYSKLIGDIDQNMMQSLLVIIQDIVQIVGPIYGTTVFSSFGLNFISYINGSIYLVGTIVWLAAWRSLRPYN